MEKSIRGIGMRIVTEDSCLNRLRSSIELLTIEVQHQRSEIKVLTEELKRMIDIIYREKNSESEKF